MGTNPNQSTEEREGERFFAPKEVFIRDGLIITGVALFAGFAYLVGPPAESVENKALSPVGFCTIAGAFYFYHRDKSNKVRVLAISILLLALELVIAGTVARLA